MRLGSIRLLVAALLVGAAGTASAAPLCTTIAGPNTNGGATLPGTNVGSVGNNAGQVCQIGDLSIYNGGSGGSFVPNSNTPSIYSFNFGGGVLSVSEQIGNNGFGVGINVDLFALASPTSTQPSSTVASIQIPFSSGPSGPQTVLSNVALGAGTYAIRTSLAGGNVPGPNFQVNFLVPEPASLALLAVPVLALIRRRTRR